MTLLVGILCDDGIVMAADGAATLGVMGTHTAQQRTARKLHVVQGKVVIGVSGHVGLGQRLAATLEEGYRASRYRGRPETAVGTMREELWKIVRPELEYAQVAAQATRNGATLQSATMTMMVGLPIEKRLCLVQFDVQCAPELASPDLPFVALGSGQPLADPFLAFIRRVVWPERGCPSLRLGILTAVWTLRHAIETNTGGISDPMQVITLQKQGADFVAEELSRDQLDAHVEAVADGERALQQWRDGFAGDGAGALNPPPT